MVEAIAWFVSLGIVGVANIATHRYVGERPKWATISLHLLQLASSLALLKTAFGTNNTTLNTLSVVFVVLLGVGALYGRQSK